MKQERYPWGKKYNQSASETEYNTMERTNCYPNKHGQPILDEIKGFTLDLSNVFAVFSSLYDK
jgi:hypothetical protein